VQRGIHTHCRDKNCRREGEREKIINQVFKWFLRKNSIPCYADSYAIMGYELYAPAMRCWIIYFLKWGKYDENCE
jgi:hypothetical protein